MKQITYLLGVIVTFIFIFIWNPFKSLEERKAELPTYGGEWIGTNLYSTPLDVL